MPSNPDLIFFSSEYAIDKVLTDEATVSYSIIAGSPGSPQQDTHTISHSQGKACFITYAFSTDNTNFYAAGTTIQFVDLAPIVNQNGHVWVDASVDTTTIYFYVNNDYNDAVTVYIKYVLDNVL